MNLIVKKVAVLGSGVMGSQIAAHCINSNIPVILFDLASQTIDEKPINKSAIAKKGIEGLTKLKPSPLMFSDNSRLIQPANYDEHLGLLSECDLVIEAIAENLEWKHDLYKLIAPYISQNAIFASNTSGISIEKLCEGIPEGLKERFCGIHFFNPPRYMHLLELIPSKRTAEVILDSLETFATSVWGKGVVRARDTPNFIANRVGVFSILSTIASAEKLNLSFDLVDALTGDKLGRPKSATFRTCDVVGIDTLSNVIKTMQSTLRGDPFFKSYQLPVVLEKLVEIGHLGQKTGAGFYKRVGKENLIFNQQTSAYDSAANQISTEVLEILKKPSNQQIALFRSCKDPQGYFIWEIYRNLFHFIAVHLESIANSAAEVDFAMRWGYGWNLGPFETWQSAGWEKIALWVQEDIDNGKTLSGEKLPDWVFSKKVITAGGVHSNKGSWSPLSGDFILRSSLPVYKKQIFKAQLLGDGTVDSNSSGTTILEVPCGRLWLDKRFEKVLILSFKSKANTISREVMDLIARAVQLAEKNYDALVIWQPTSLQIGGAVLFSAGADLSEAAGLYKDQGLEGIEWYVKKFQETVSSVKYSNVPVISAVAGLALGGGCELIMHSARRVVAAESYLGLVESGVGLLPAGGGLKELAIGCSKEVMDARNSIFLDYVKPRFLNVSLAKVSSSAQEAIKMGYLQKSDVIVPNIHELLYQSLLQAQTMAQSGYRAPMKDDFKVGGRSLKATLKGILINMKDGGFISEHDFFIGDQIAHVISGGDVDDGALVSEEWLFKLERQAFIKLFTAPKTQERIAHMLTTHKPLRN